MEIARPGRQGLFSGVVNVAFNQGGNLMASLICFLASMAFGTSAMQSWGWRIPFHENATAVFGVTTLLMLIMVAVGPLSGYLADHFGSSTTGVAVGYGIWWDSIVFAYCSTASRGIVVVSYVWARSFVH